MLSSLELRHIIESGFLPAGCECRKVAADGLSVRIFDSSTGKTRMFVSGIALSSLSGRDAIYRLITELKDELWLAENIRGDDGLQPPLRYDREQRERRRI